MFPWSSATRRGAPRGEVHSIADMYAAEACHLLKAENDREAGWQRLHTYLDDGPACRVHAALGWAECPMLHVFDTCSNLVRVMPDQVHDEIDVEDLDTKGEDHLPDAIRYALMAVGLRPPKQPKAAPDMSAEARMARHIDSRINKRKRTRGRAIG